MIKKYCFIVTVQWAARSRPTGGHDYTLRVYRLDPAQEYGFSFIAEADRCRGQDSGPLNEGWALLCSQGALPPRILKAMTDAYARDPTMASPLHYYKPSLMIPMGVWMQEIQ